MLRKWSKETARYFNVFQKNFAW